MLTCGYGLGSTAGVASLSHLQACLPGCCPLRPCSTWVDPGCKRDCIPLRILQVEVPFKLAVEGDHAYGSSRWAVQS